MIMFIDRTDQIYERLTVIERTESTRSGKARWLCQCECGNTKTVRGSGLANGHTKSCGCLQKERMREILTTHGHNPSPNTSKPSREYNTWANMIQRCTNPKNNRYKYYGGRGITICKAWLNSFEQFFEDMGKKPEGLSIDRIDNDGNYEPGNCRWATTLEQRHNRRN